MSEEEKNSIRDKVSEAIKSGEVKMRPRWHFAIRALIAVIAVAVILLALLYLLSFIVFSLHQTGAWFVPAFGFHGISTFFISLPWLLFLIGLVLFIILEFLVKRYSFSHRRPLIYSIFVIVFVISLGGFITARTSFHRDLYERAEKDNLPILGQFYRGVALQRFDEIHRGFIIKITESGFLLGNPFNETLEIIIGPETRFPFGVDFVEGDEVVVFGKRDDDVIHAFGIRQIDFNEERFGLRLMRPHFMLPPNGF